MGNVSYQAGCWSIPYSCGTPIQHLEKHLVSHSGIRSPFLFGLAISTYMIRHTARYCIRIWISRVLFWKMSSRYTENSVAAACCSRSEFVQGAMEVLNSNFNDWEHTPMPNSQTFLETKWKTVSREIPKSLETFEIGGIWWGQTSLFASEGMRFISFSVFIACENFPIPVASLWQVPCPILVQLPRRIWKSWC